jgi:predicted nucleotidyltransferase
VSVYWLNQKQLRTHLKEAVQRLAQRHPEIDEVWLFGSLARGDAVPGSDADLLIVLEESTLPFLARSVHYQPDFCGVGVDTLVYTRAELAAMQAEDNPFLRQIQSERVLLCQTSKPPIDAGKA